MKANQTNLLRSVLGVIAAASMTGSLHADVADPLRHELVGRTVVFKMEMPLVKGAVVSPDGQLDRKLYGKRMKKHRPVFTPGERAEITKIELKGNELKICFNGCGIGFLPPLSRVAGNLDKHGSALIVSFPGTVTAQDADPARILPLLEGVASVEGLDVARAPAEVVPGPSQVSNSGTDASPSLELLSVTVEPAEVHPGESVRLVLQFELLDSGQEIPITEERQIYRNDQALLSVPRSSTQAFGAGRQRTQVEFQVPPDAAPGAYTLEGTVRGAGVEKVGRAVFVVRQP